ncbi:MAG: hypothetical protein OEM23_01520 [Gemmatimonadota bacterium]|nr:hypothetical protein [Gemmatimonadota bacterium]MDH3427090.1 hypothetical protein [Gemmatimonadota bacterium]
MRTNLARLCASLLIVLFVAPQAVAQDDEGMVEADKAHHVHLGTMTPPGQQAMDISYEISMVDGGHEGWIVVNAGGQEIRVEMEDLEMNRDLVSYHWSPPDGDVIITCELEASEGGGWAGECIDNEDGETGLMTIAPMSMNHDHAEDDHEDDDHEDDEQ